MPQAKFKILLVDDHPIIALGIATLLTDASEFELIGKAQDHTEAMDLVGRLKPDLMVLDLLMGGRDGFELITTLTGQNKGLRIVVYSSLPEQTHARRAFRAGARGYVMKETGLVVLLEAIRAVARGESYASDAIKQALLEDCINGRAACDTERLSNQELHIFRLIGLGLGSAEIAAKLGISPKTVSSHRERIKDKLGVQTARDLNRKAELFSLDSPLSTTHDSYGER